MDINVKRLRCILGWLALSLSWVVAVLLWYIPDSISITYYTYRAGPVFMIILGACSFLLIAYRGYELVDDILATLAGMFGILICLFPCENFAYEYVGTFQIPMSISSIIHNTSAVCFFAILSIMSAFLFTKSDGNMTKKKRARNIIYRVCAVGMILSFTLFFVPNFYAKTWIIETIALFFFSISFLTKANAYWFLFSDN